MNTWTIHVEDFGKVEKADIELAPMTLFVGDNNSGKSHIMTLIYGLMNVNFYSEQYQFDDQSENFKNCRRFIDKVCEICNGSDNTFKMIEMTYEEIKVFENVLNELLAANKDRLVRELFNKQISIGNLNLRLHKNNKYNFLCSTSCTTEHIERISISKITGKRDPITECSCQVEKRNGSYEYRQLISFIIKHMINESFGMQSTYFPASRTGYLINDVFNLNLLHKKLLTRPNNDFLTKLSVVVNNNLTGDALHMVNAVQSAINIIENNIIKGKILVSDMSEYDILYQPNETDVQFPMFAASGAVTQAVLLLLFLQNEVIQTIFIEEPEISLHPKIQCEMARVLIRLVNSDIPVFASTHSDIILQHINNMIKLAGAVRREKIGKKLGYEECDWVDKEKVTVYHFDVNDSGKTAVIKLPCGEFGFEAMTFYNTLEKLNQQIRIIEEK